jgi:hypothetical protein
MKWREGTDALPGSLPRRRENNDALIGMLHAGCRLQGLAVGGDPTGLTWVSAPSLQMLNVAILGFLG